MKRILTLITLLTFCPGLAGLTHAAPPQADAKQGVADPASGVEDGNNPSGSNASVWMEKKLKHSEAILRALAMGDFEQVEYNARRLKLLNRVEGFVRRKHPEYRAHLNTFSRVTAEIERQAQRENIEGATLAFNQLTVSCVQCHKALRSGLGEGAVDKTQSSDE